MTEDQVIYDRHGFAVIDEKNGRFSIQVAGLSGGCVNMSEVYKDRNFAIARAEYLSHDPQASERIYRVAERLAALERLEDPNHYDDEMEVDTGEERYPLDKMGVGNWFFARVKGTAKHRVKLMHKKSDMRFKVFQYGEGCRVKRVE